MSAAVHDRYGDADVIRVASVPVPAIADDEVLVRVEAAGLDRGTWHLLTGQPYLVRLATGLRRPRAAVLGRDVAGTVIAKGGAVHRLAVGDPVFGVATGSFAEYARAKERKLSRRPDRVSAAEAAVLGISGMTALQAVDAASLDAGSTLLVIGASGGVGSYVVQIAHGLGARVTGVSRAAKADFVRSLGAERVVAYDNPGENHDGLYDAIIDTGGDTALARLRSMLAPRGTLVIVGGERGDAVTGMGDSCRPASCRPPYANG
jgi:NADPH:quinone reductase-like Zn-dependent oxidoreductase